MRLVDDVMRGTRLLTLVAQRDPKVESATPDILHHVGTVGVIHQLARAGDGTIRMMVQGLERVRLKDWIQTEPYLVARIEQAPDEMPGGTEVEALRQAVVDVFSRLVAVSNDLPDELPVAARSLPDPRHVAYFVASANLSDYPNTCRLSTLPHRSRWDVTHWARSTIPPRAGLRAGSRSSRRSPATRPPTSRGAASSRSRSTTCRPTGSSRGSRTSPSTDRGKENRSP